MAARLRRSSTGSASFARARQPAPQPRSRRPAYFQRALRRPRAMCCRVTRAVLLALRLSRRMGDMIVKHLGAEVLCLDHRRRCLTCRTLTGPCRAFCAPECAVEHTFAVVERAACFDCTEGYLAVGRASCRWAAPPAGPQGQSPRLARRRQARVRNVPCPSSSMSLSSSILAPRRRPVARPARRPLIVDCYISHKPFKCTWFVDIHEEELKAPKQKRTFTHPKWNNYCMLHFDDVRHALCSAALSFVYFRKLRSAARAAIYAHMSKHI